MVFGAFGISNSNSDFNLHLNLNLSSNSNSNPDSTKTSAKSLTKVSQVSSLNKLPPRLGSNTDIFSGPICLESTDFGGDGEDTRTILDTVNGRTSINGLDFNILIVDKNKKRKSKSFGVADRKPLYANEF